METWKKTNWKAYQHTGKSYDYSRPLKLYAHLGKHFKKLLLSHLPQKTMILDGGCGTGNSIHFLDKVFSDATIHGVEIAQNMLAVAKRKKYRNKVRLFYGDLETYTALKPYDAVQFFMVLHHFKNLDKILLNTRKLLKPKGKLIVMGVHSTNYLVRFLDAFYRSFLGQGNYVARSDSELTKTVERYGFTKIAKKTHHVLQNYTIIIFEKKTLGSKIKRG